MRIGPEAYSENIFDIFRVFTQGVKSTPPMNKLTKLKKIISGYKSCLIAFSGGVDSSLLLKITSLVLPKDKILAVTAISPTYPKKELINAKKVAQELDVRHKIIKTDELKDAKFVNNPTNRCYYCKKELFLRLNSIAKKQNLNFVLDASNITDKKDFRPGNIAKKELKVKSPLVQAGFSKEDIRRLSNKFKLKNWNKPALACLASRIPYNIKISANLLKQIEKAETYLQRLGFNHVRVRHYNDSCRIEVHRADIKKLIGKSNLIVDRFKNIGYNYITLDLEGYRTGSLNEVLKK